MEEENVKVKISSCPKCEGIIRVAVEHEMTEETKKSFGKEVMKYNLNVNTVSLEEYRKSLVDWCKCN